jgi:mono/diheme cytochrome c family protein
MKKYKINLPKYFVLSFFGAGILLFAVDKFRSSSGETQATVKIPVLSELAKTGEVAYSANCASCHGKNGSGTDSGPPLIHDIYNPGHHSDAAFYMAALKGVRGHHWRYGNMPAQPQASKKDLVPLHRGYDGLD